MLARAMRGPRTVVAALAAAVLLAAPLAAGAQERRTELVRIAFPSEDGSLTPYTFTIGYQLMTLVYDTLTWRDAAGVPRPWLARSVRREGRRVTVRLRERARWHDGRALTAADVAFSYRYMAVRRHPRFTLQLRDIAAIRTPDARTVVFELRRPSLGFVDQPLADVPIIPRHLWEGLPAGRAAPPGLAVGSGPYRLIGHDGGRGYMFEANDEHFRGRPLVARLEAEIIGDEQTAFEALRARREGAGVDLVPANLPAGKLRQRSRRLRYDRTPSFTGTMLAFNLAAPPFDRLAARRAVADALDLERIAGAGRGAGAMAPAVRGALHPRSRWAGEETLHRPDPAAARRAFAEGDLGPLTVLASSDDGVRLEAGRRVVAALQRAGASAQLVELPAERLQRALGREGARPAFQAAVVGLPALASYDPAYLRTVFGDPGTAALNDFGYRSARFARADRRLAAAGTRAQRRRAVADELALLARDLPALPLFFGGTSYAYRRAGYSGWVGVRGVGVLDKRSFVPGPRSADSRAAAARDPRDPVPPGGGGSLVPWIGGLAALLLAGLGIAIARGGRGRPPRGRSR